MVVIIFWCMTSNLIAQHEISKYEYQWAIFHPFAAKKIQKHLIETMDVYQIVKNAKTLDGFESGGTLDAFRHAFTMAYMCRFVKTSKLRKLGKAHEKGNEYYFYKNHPNFYKKSFGSLQDQPLILLSQEFAHLILF